MSRKLKRTPVKIGRKYFKRVNRLTKMYNRVRIKSLKHNQKFLFKTIKTYAKPGNKVNTKNSICVKRKKLRLLRENKITKKNKLFIYRVRRINSFSLNNKVRKVLTL